MLSVIKSLIKEEDGLGTVEIVLIIAILVGIALLFKKQIIAFVAKIMGNVVSTDVKPVDIENTKVK